MKRLIFSLPYGMAFRNIVCCGIVDGCLRRGAEATVLIPSLTGSDSERVRGELPGGVDVRPLMAPRPSLFLFYLKGLKQYLYARRTRLESFEIKYQRRWRQKPVFHWFASAAERTGGWLLSEATVDRLLAQAKQPYEAAYLNLLREARADTVVITKPGYNPEDLPLIKAARALRIPVVSVDTTWDNMVAKRPPYLRPDALTLWNDRMMRDAVECYRFSPVSVAVTGGAQFDIFFRRNELPCRSQFLSSLNLDPSRKLIVFTLSHTMFAPDNDKYISLLLDAIQSGKIEGTPNLVVRIHPWDRGSNFDSSKEQYSSVRIERPFGMPEAASVFECIPSRGDVLHYGALMTHADALINIASTTSLDAMASDTPVVNIAFDLRSTFPETSVARLYGFNHYKPIVDTLAVRIAHSPEELFATVNAYLDDPGLDAAERERARKQFLTFSDGQSADRVAEAIHALA